MHGFLNIDKPAGITSHDAVARVRKITRQKRIGHAGTLDPAATGVLVLALGSATRLIEFVQDETRKAYTARVLLGTTTTTDDAEGEVTSTQDVPALTSGDIEAALAPLRGTIMQVPPAYSALHHQGQRLYDLARAGQTPDVPARPVTVYELLLTAWEPPYVTLTVICGKGTYVRSLARDLGATLGCGAHLAALRRTAVGTFTLETALSLDALTSESASAALLPPETAVLDWSRAELSEPQVKLVRNGLRIGVSGVLGNRARAHAPDGTLVALLERTDGGQWQPTKVFPGDAN